ncbi:MAG TPA: hypothetical protein DCS66_18935 [Flavobacteriaceae bacterium]|nr:hypothetical protein [Flavobacteriaceae bacterium]|tara:strand:- start:190 stop:732 length:543 start_codon:yes stop_codon:yes gene_type:complete
MRYLYFFLFVVLVSCNEGSEDIYRTTSGEYASKKAGFVAKFPGEPSLSVIENKLGYEKFDILLYSLTLGNYKIYRVEYLDYPESLIKNKTSEELLNEGFENLKNSISDDFDLDFKEPVEIGEDKGIYFVFTPKEEVPALFLGKIFVKNKKHYTVSYLGKTDGNVDAFMKSFRFLNQTSGN